MKERLLFFVLTKNGGVFEVDYRCEEGERSLKCRQIKRNKSSTFTAANCYSAVVITEHSGLVLFDSCPDLTAKQVDRVQLRGVNTSPIVGLLPTEEQAFEACQPINQPWDSR